jgi:serine phosphatase RsbU (regulator of sigma subunit)
MFDADMAAIGEIKKDNTLEIGMFDGLDPGAFRVPVVDSIAQQTFTAAQPLVVDDLQFYPKARPEFTKIGIHSLMAAPIVHDGRPIGALYIGSLQYGRFSSEDANILIAFAQHVSIALANAEHYEREHRIAESLQKVIFPPSELQIGQFRIAGKYQPAWDEAQVGGDYYDYFDLGDGKVGVAIGDVSGKGLNAAVHTAIVKYSFQAYAREGFEPSAAIQRVDEAFRKQSARGEVSDNVFITLFYAVLDTETGKLVYSNAGHEPPVKLTANGDVESLQSTGPIVGLSANRDFGQAETMLGKGDTLVLYTDGITEARVGGALFGHDRLVSAIKDCSGCSPEELAERVYDEAKSYANNVVQDDVALVVILNCLLSCTSDN